MTHRDKWLQTYEANKAKNKSFLIDNQKPEKVYKCRICGQHYQESQEDEHEAQHSTAPPSGSKYYLTTSYREANSDIKNGAKFIPLMINYYKNKFIETWYNALQLNNWQKITDYNNTSIRWNAKEKKFVRVMWFLALIITTVLMQSSNH